jgi:non-ribosomal peptide synthetase component F
LPLSFAQQRLWFLDQFEPGSSAYNMPFALRLKGPLDVDALERAMTEIVRRHEVLRTTFRIVDEQPVQVVGEPAAFVLPVIQDCEDRVVEQLIQDEASRPFDLEAGPLVRARLLRRSEQEHVLVFTMHHIISDGWSMGVLMREVGALYNAYSCGEESPLGELPIQYGDYAVWQREWLREEALDQQLEYWRKQLANAPALELPTDRPRPAVPRHEGASVSFALDAEVTGKLRELSRQEGATLFMTLLAAFQTLLRRYTGQTDVSVGTPIAGRTRAEVEGLVGFFVNTLVLRVDASEDPTFRELLQRVRETCFGAYAHQDVPFEKLVEELRPEREMSRPPLFQVMLVLNTREAEMLRLAGVELEQLVVPSRTAKFDLSLSFSETDHGLKGTMEYDADLFDAATVRRMLEHFRILLGGIAGASDTRLSLLSLLTDDERLQLLSSHRPAQKRDHDCLHHLFEAQAARTPNAIALTFADERLTYDELNQRTDRFAHRLRAFGVGPDTLVGVLSQRSTGMVVAILGVLKAGGAYLPLDPSYPAERLRFMLVDSGARVLLVGEGVNEALAAVEGCAHTLRIENLCEDEGDEVAVAGGAVARNLAYVIYTSGSSGKPKGVMIEHGAIVNHMKWMLAEFPLRESDRVLQKTPFSFDASVWEFYAPLLGGAELVVARPGAHQDGAYLARLIAAASRSMLATNS